MANEPFELEYFYYDPTPEPPPPPAGVTKAWVVIWSGEPGPARVAPAAVLVDDDGTSQMVVTGDFEDTEVVDRDDQPD